MAGSRSLGNEFQSLLLRNRQRNEWIVRLHALVMGHFALMQLACI